MAVINNNSVETAVDLFDVQINSIKIKKAYCYNDFKTIDLDNFEDIFEYDGDYFKIKDMILMSTDTDPLNDLYYFDGKDILKALNAPKHKSKIKYRHLDYLTVDDAIELYSEIVKK
jgi:hypothetical protein